MSKKQVIKAKIDNSNSELEGKAFCCSEVFTLDRKGNIIKSEWKRKEEKD